MENDTDLIVIGGSSVGKSDFIKLYERKAQSFISATENVNLEECVSGTIPHNIYKKEGALIMFDTSSLASLKEAIALASEVPIPKVLVGNIMHPSEISVSHHECTKRAAEVGCPYIETSTTLKKSITFPLEVLISEINKKKDSQKKRRFVFRLSPRSIKALKFFALICAGLTTLESLVFVIFGSLMAVSSSENDIRLASDSMINSGALGFVMSFVGMYGVKKSGIKEYLKVFVVILLINCCYKVVMGLLYINLENVEGLGVESLVLVVVSVFIELLTAFSAFIELNKIVELQKFPSFKVVNRTLSIIR